jgi:hypothetical protein
MKAKLFKLSSPFFVNKTENNAGGMFVTFWAIPTGATQLKQFFIFEEVSDNIDFSDDFSVLLLANVDDWLEFKADKNPQICGLGFQAHRIVNVSRPTLNPTNFGVYG